MQNLKEICGMNFKIKAYKMKPFNRFHQADWIIVPNMDQMESSTPALVFIFSPTLNFPSTTFWSIMPYFYFTTFM